MAAVQAAAPRVSWAWIWGMLVVGAGWCAAVRAQRLCARTNFCSRGLPFDLRSRRRRRRIRSAKNSAGPRDATSRGSDLRAKSQSNVSLCLSSRAQETGRRHGTVGSRAASTTPGNLDQSGLFWLLLSPGYRRDMLSVCRWFWGHIKSFLRNQDRERGGVWGVGFR